MPNKKEITMKDLQDMTSQQLCELLNDYFITAKNKKQNYGKLETVESYGFVNMKWSDIRKVVDRRNDIEKLNDDYITHADLEKRFGDAKNTAMTIQQYSDNEQEALNEFVKFIANEPVMTFLQQVNKQPECLFNHIDFIRLIPPKKTANKTYKIDTAASNRLDTFCKEHSLYPKSAIMSTGIHLVIDALERQDAQLQAILDISNQGNKTE